MARVLKPGGRVAVSDNAMKKPLPPESGDDLLAYVGCIAGAIPIQEYLDDHTEAGIAHVDIIDSRADLNAYAQVDGQVGCCGGEMVAEPVSIGPVPSGTPAPSGSSDCCTPAGAATPELIFRLAELARLYNLNDYAASVKVFAVKPATPPL